MFSKQKLYSQATIAIKCIPKGEELTHIYQCHFATTPKDQRQSTLQRVFHFKCRCNACEKDFPLANRLPRTFIDGASLFSGKSIELEKYLQALKQSLKSVDLDRLFIVKNEKIFKAFKSEVKNLEKKKDLKTIKKLLSVLDDYNKIMNEEIKNCIASKDVEKVLPLYYTKQMLANMFLKSPHAIFISSLEAIIDCLLIKHANISYGIPRGELLGKFNAYYYRNLL